MTNELTNNEETIAELSAAKFLEDVPPGEVRQLAADAWKFPQNDFPTFTWPAIELYCSNTTCAGFRFADPGVKSAVEFSAHSQERSIWCAYSCRNCKTFLKLFAIVLTSPRARHQAGSALKVGEYPVFGPHLPPNVVELLGGDADYFLKGHRSEAQGLGIAAFAYYRRVVENQRTRIFDEIISAAEHVVPIRQ
jgi:hypothetical protein